jgi:hypothetical protein
LSTLERVTDQHYVSEPALELALFIDECFPVSWHETLNRFLTIELPMNGNADIMKKLVDSLEKDLGPVIERLSTR